MSAGELRYPTDELVPLLHRANALPEFYRGYLDGHVNAAVKALQTGLELCEAMAADKERKARSAGLATRRGRLRVIEGQRLA